MLFYQSVVGMGVGGEFGIGMTAVTETWSKNKRAKATSIVALGWQLGVLTASVLPVIIVPAFGWRAVFLVGLIPALLALFVRKSLEEPETWRQKNLNKKGFMGKRLARVLCERHDRRFLGPF